MVSGIPASWEVKTRRWELSNQMLRQCDLNFCDSAVDFGPEERVYTLSLKISQVIEFRVHKPSFFLTPTCHCHTPQSTTICKLSKPSCEHFLSLSIQLFSWMVFYGNCRYSEEPYWNPAVPW